MVVPPRKPSLRARMIYGASRRIAPPMVRRMVIGNGRRPLPDRLSRTGRRVNSLARLQRRRPLRGVRVIRHSAEPLTETVRRADCTQPISDGVILYFHGGGFVTGGLDTHLGAVAALARRTRLPVVHVDYRQYPVGTVDVSVQDCCQAYRWLLEQGANPAKVVLAGDSAGGFLAFATALRVQQDGLPAPAGVVGISAVLELDSTTRNTHANVGRDAFGVPTALAAIIEHVCPSAELVQSLAPINGRLETMPPSLLIAADSEILCCDAERLRDALTAANRPCELRTWPSQLHAFPAIFPFLPESKEAFEAITRFVQQRLAEADQDLGS
ncbi:alpha/beta hydrolase [Mycobacterium talmoniae]|uniref:Lipase n=1 Tax=Mycobacterium talmoniae TaxID=1858794 RepID=A0A1S1NKK8_9MYCO|nr:alpha/beta hydrolase fold domain-containing protein [Mycobacterium talmoniae]OHV04539.1 lipase [Mycobacterium talmoniae]